MHVTDQHMLYVITSISGHVTLNQSDALESVHFSVH